MKSIFLLLLLGLATTANAAPERLTIADYLNQVSGKSPSTAAARLHGDGGLSRADGASVLTFPYLFGSATALDDQAQPALPAVQGTETKANVYTLGVGVNSPWGLNGKYSWNTGYTEVIGIAFPSIGNYTSYNKIDLTLNLGRNGFGSEISSRRDLIRSANMAQSLAGNYQLLGTLTQAETAYWRLAIARQSVLVDRETLARSEKLLAWAKKRVGLQLGDRSDVLQAQATYDLHTIELSSALEEERNSARAFNILRNEEGEKVPEAVGLPSIEETLKMEAPGRAAERLDIQAAAEKTKAAQAQSQLDKEALKPSVDVVAAYAWNGRKPLRSDAISDAFGNRHPTKSIGVAFTVPLNVPVWQKGIKGADQEIEAAGYELDQSRLAEVKDWNELTSHLAEARSRLKLMGTLEEVQRDKFENERQRLLRGRTTTYQTLTFEQDYSAAQLLRLRTQAEVLQIIAQMKLFRGKP